MVVSLTLDEPRGAMRVLCAAVCGPGLAAGLERDSEAVGGRGDRAALRRASVCPDGKRRSHLRPLELDLGNGRLLTPLPRLGLWVPQPFHSRSLL